MIKKLENGTTVIQLGKGTVFTGNVYINDNREASGIYFTNEKDGKKPKEDIVIEITDMSGIASYLVSLFRVLETWDIDDEEKSKAFREELSDFQTTLEKHLSFTNKQ